MARVAYDKISQAFQGARPELHGSMVAVVTETWSSCEHEPVELHVYTATSYWSVPTYPRGTNVAGNRLQESARHCLA